LTEVQDEALYQVATQVCAPERLNLLVAAIIHMSPAPRFSYAMRCQIRSGQALELQATERAKPILPLALPASATAAVQAC